MNCLKLAAVLVVASGLIGCEIVGFNIDEAIDEQVVEGNLIGSLVGFALPIPFEVDLEEEVASRNTGPVQHVYMRRLYIEITETAMPSGDEDDFDFVDWIEVYVESTDPSTTLPTVLIGSAVDIPSGATRIDFDIEEVDLKQYIEEGVRVVTTASGSAPPDDVSFDGGMRLHVEVL